MMRKIPLVVILGSTGTGKTKLSIELAERFGGEIISADSMQVYKNLDVVTAKATRAEQERVPHHLLSVCSSTDPFTVVHFRNSALPIIDNLLINNKIPIIVGGTNYYIESLLWNFVLGSPSGETTLDVFNEANEYKFEELSSDELYNQLREIDPISAKKIHPNNKRKLVRALEVYHKSGKSLSAILDEQRSKPGGNRLGGPLRYQHVILFSLQCNQEILNNRLDKRVDCMLEQGLLQEIRNFFESANVSSGSNAFTKGILQTIGLKEFFPYLQKFNRENDAEILEFLQKRSFVLSDEKSNDEPEGLDLLRMCLKDLKLVTQRYSKRQIKWVKNRFLGSKDRNTPPLYGLNTTNVAEWNENVYLPALDVIESYINERSPKLEPLSAIQHPNEGMNEDVSFFCDICKRHFVGEYQWHLHLKSNKHKRVKDGQRRKRNREEAELNTK